MLCANTQIQEALKNDLARFQFEGREIKLDPRAGIFITMVRLNCFLLVAGTLELTGRFGQARRKQHALTPAPLLLCGFDLLQNPGYAGRTELPDNLKALFRPVTMVVPDMEQICEIMLFSEGFDSAKVRACRLAATVPARFSAVQTLCKDYAGVSSLRVQQLVWP
jgi:dynein heavy chain